MTKTTNLKGGWDVRMHPDDPSNSFKLGRADGKFFRVVFNCTKYGQPLIEEVLDQKGYAGYVVPIVKLIDGVWNVVVSYNERPANDYAEKLLEGARRSASNDAPFIAAEGEKMEPLPGFLYTNSARIAGKVKVGVLNVSDVVDFQLPSNAEFMPFKEFFDKSSDALTKAALGHFMVSVLGCLEG